MLLRENFEILHAVNGYFSAFSTFLRQILLKFFDPTAASEWSYFTKYDALCSHIFDYAYLRRKAYFFRRGSKLWKNCISQKHS